MQAHVSDIEREYQSILYTLPPILSEQVHSCVCESMAFEASQGQYMKVQRDKRTRVEMLKKDMLVFEALHALHIFKHAHSTHHMSPRARCALKYHAAQISIFVHESTRVHNYEAIQAHISQLHTLVHQHTAALHQLQLSLPCPTHTDQCTRVSRPQL